MLFVVVIILNAALFVLQSVVRFDQELFVEDIQSLDHAFHWQGWFVFCIFSAMDFRLVRISADFFEVVADHLCAIEDYLLAFGDLLKNWQINNVFIHALLIFRILLVRTFSLDVASEIISLVLNNSA